MTLIHLCLQNHKLYFPAKANQCCDLPPLVVCKGFSLLTHIYCMTVSHYSVPPINFSIFFVGFNTVQNILSFFKQCDYLLHRAVIYQSTSTARAHCAPQWWSRSQCDYNLASKSVVAFSNGKEIFMTYQQVSYIITRFVYLLQVEKS